jgi:biopolymer transport protein TolR
LQDQSKPITVSVRADGRIFIGQTETPFSSFADDLRTAAGEAYTKPIYVRADGRAPYAMVAQVMASLSQSGFTSIDLITDTGGPNSGALKGNAPNSDSPAPTPAS